MLDDEGRGGMMDSVDNGKKRAVHGDHRLAPIAGAAHPSYLTLALPAPKPASESGPVGVLDRQPTKGSTRDR
jgi:hypothetical protein